MAKGFTIFNGIKLVERSRTSTCGIKHFTWLSEVETADAVLVNSENGFYIVEANESVIFYSYSDAAQSTFHIFPCCYIFLIPFIADLIIELVIIRDIVFYGPVSQPLYAWLKDVIMQACSERRNVRVGSTISSISLH
jgi:hypothetical protein